MPVTPHCSGMLSFQPYSFSFTMTLVDTSFESLSPYRPTLFSSQTPSEAPRCHSHLQTQFQNLIKKKSLERHEKVSQGIAKRELIV